VPAEEFRRIDQLIEEAFERIEPDAYLASINTAAMTDELNNFLLQLYGLDPFAPVYDASESHRAHHGLSLPGGEQECGVYPSNHLKMRILATIVRTIRARRLLEIGGGLGYSALWFASALADKTRVETIDRFTEHVAQLNRFARQFGFADRIVVLEGEADAILPGLSGQYDVIHDDGWFGQQPAYYDRMIELLRPGGLLIMSNWFLLEHAVSGQSPVDWSQFAGPTWAEDIKAYADVLASDIRLDVSFVPQPPFALATKRTDV
jgi:predicted O-methyltransferase YrrM